MPTATKNITDENTERTNVAASDDASLGVSLVIGRRRCFVVPIRWRALAVHNVVATFNDLHDASVAARRLAAVPSSVSAAVLVPVDAQAATSVVVGVHTGNREVADEAAVSLRRSGARRVVRFPQR